MTTPGLPLPDSYPRATWRLIVDAPAEGARNMAVDEALAAHVANGRVLPTLRFYTWNPPCLSLGYAQPAADADFERLHWYGWDIVRRLTGGRAILHTDELTYSVAVPLSDPRVTGGVVESYQRLSQGLLAGLAALGAAVEADRASGEARGFKGPVCFEVPSDYEITANERKLLGSAQTRRGGNVVMQHGALPLSGDPGRICDALVFASEADREAARERVRARAITLEAALGRPVSIQRVIAALASGFASALNLDLVESSLTASEQAYADELRTHKYASSAWTGRH